LTLKILEQIMPTIDPASASLVNSSASALWPWAEGATAPVQNAAPATVAPQAEPVAASPHALWFWADKAPAAQRSDVFFESGVVDATIDPAEIGESAPVERVQKQLA
jgi:hypothetical protein